MLQAVGIPAEVDYRDGYWQLVVRRSDRPAATAELEAYRLENQDRSTVRSRPVPVYGGAADAALVYAGVLILVASLSLQSAFELEWVAAGAMRAGRVVGGEWWRSITALTLHVDAAHLVGNLIFGGVFGFLAGRVLGGGVAWLVIATAGALGNGINALMRAPNHWSIGASTAVFAALGVIVAHALLPWTDPPERPLKRWSPLIAGTVLLAFTGVGGQRTDVAAHVAGFLAGLLLGWLGCRLPSRLLASRAVQQWAGFTTIALVGSAWAAAILTAR